MKLNNKKRGIFVYQLVISEPGNKRVMTGRLQNFEIDGVLIRLEGGLGEEGLAVFDDVVLTAVLREDKDHFIFKSCRLTDLFKLSDYRGGFSKRLNIDGDVFVCYVPCGNILVTDTDILDFTITNNSSLTSENIIELYAVDQIDGNEVILQYESITGGQELVLNNVLAIMSTSEASGSANVVSSDLSYSVPLEACQGLANAQGNLEHFTEFGIIYSDGLNIGDQVTVSLPAGNYLINRRVYDVNRYVKSHGRAAGVVEDRVAKLKRRDSDIAKIVLHEWGVS